MVEKTLVWFEIDAEAAKPLVINLCGRSYLLMMNITHYIKYLLVDLLCHLHTYDDC